MTATIIKMSIQRMICTGCGAEANASCNCGVAYQPKSLRAADAIKANPQRSDRAIAADLGISPTTVGKARHVSIGGHVSDRTGLDGKVYRVSAHEIEPEDDVEADIEPENYRTAYLLRADQARRFAVYSGPVTDEIAEYARVVIKAWTALVEDLEFELRKKQRRER
jgi:hypothetical protein